ncbi:MAG: hypothetical protein SPI25_06815 [Dialister sp.]|nr:hypothetical protein [Dialister sp.]
MTPKEANLFYLLGYGLAVTIVLFSLWQKNKLNPRRTITRKIFAWRLLWMALIAMAGEALLVGSYFIFSGAGHFYFFTAVMMIMSVLEYVLMISSFFQRYAVYPRGRALTLVILALYVLADLFMPFGTKYGIAVAGFLGGFILPDSWDDWAKRKE